VLLVYADPTGNLPKAANEVATIRDRLTQDWGRGVEITELFGEQATGTALTRELRSGGHHVVHYAGHAAFHDTNPERSCLLLHDGEIFFAQKIQRVLEGRPLVFLNACESSQTANEDSDPSTTYLGEQTQGLASAFNYGGAQACVGALWPVYDDTAAEFAVEFYQAFFEGNRVGEALRLARQKIRAERPDHITWASYALYGDPTFRMPFIPLKESATAPPAAAGPDTEDGAEAGGGDA
jgi:CHAT domain-containing protein